MVRPRLNIANATRERNVGSVKIVATHFTHTSATTSGQYRKNEKPVSASVRVPSRVIKTLII